MKKLKLIILFIIPSILFGNPAVVEAEETLTVAQQVWGLTGALIITMAWFAVLKAILVKFKNRSGGA